LRFVVLAKKRTLITKIEIQIKQAIYGKENQAIPAIALFAYQGRKNKFR
jgi:hypothetical protein